MTARIPLVEALEPRRLLAADFDVVGETILKDGVPFVPVGSNYNGEDWVHGPGPAKTKDLVNVSKNAWKFNAIRVNNFMDPSNAKFGTYGTYNKISEIVSAYTAADVVVMLELHDWTGGYPTGDDRAAALDWWEDTARTYKGNEHVWFNVMNEPAGGGAVSTQWRDFHRDPIRRIRDVAGAGNVIVLDGAAWGQDLGENSSTDPDADSEKSGILTHGNDVKRFGGKTYDDIVFSLHLYDQWGWGTDSFNKAKLVDYVDRVRGEGHALIFGEAGKRVADSSTHSYAKALRAAYEIAAEQHVGVLSWSFNQIDNFYHVDGDKGYGDKINSWTNPTNLSDMGEIVWDHSHAYRPPTNYQRPYGSTIPSITSQINAERYDKGGQGRAYNDTNSRNEGPAGFRTGEGVDIGGGGGNYNVGWIRDGEWIEYTVSVPSTGNYDLKFNVAADANTGARIYARVGEDDVGYVSVPDTGGYSSYWTLTLPNVALDAGPEMKVRLRFQGGDFNLNWFRAQTPPALRAAFVPTATVTATATRDSLFGDVLIAATNAEEGEVMLA